MKEHENVFWTAILVALLVSMILATSVQAQTAPVPIDLSKGVFKWTWTQGTLGAAEKFQVRCGPVTAIYTLTKDVLDPALRQMAMNQIITAEGTYFCAVYAANAGGTSGPSSEVSFRAYKLPGAASSFEVYVP